MLQAHPTYKMRVAASVLTITLTYCNALARKVASLLERRPTLYVMLCVVKPTVMLKNVSNSECTYLR